MKTNFKKHKLLSQLVRSAEEKVKELLEKDPVDIDRIENDRDIEKEGGVYLVHRKKKGIIYVGIAIDLKRIIRDHCGCDRRANRSTLRRTIIEEKYQDINNGQKAGEWIKKHCFFSYIFLSNQDMRDLVEALTIAFLRKNGTKLLNKK